MEGYGRNGGTLKVPQADQASVPEHKIVGYLLSLTHPDGRSKAVFFLRVGFRADQWQTLADALREHVSHYDIVEERQTPFGISYAVEGPLMSPRGWTASVRTVWFVDSPGAAPRLVTACPTI
jgi:hypothetical protein